MSGSLHSSCKMDFSEDDGYIMLDKFGGNNLNLYKFKLEMVMSIKDLC